MPSPAILASVVCIGFAALAIPSIAVSWHRLVAGHPPVGLRVLIPSRRTFTYLWRLWIVQTILGGVTGLVGSNSQDIAEIVGVSDPRLIALVIQIAILSLVVWRGSQWSLIFPAIAISDHPPQARELVSLAKQVGNGLPFGFIIVVIFCQLEVLAAIISFYWGLKRAGATAALVGGIVELTLTFVLIAMAATFLSRAYDAALRAAGGSEQCSTA